MRESSCAWTIGDCGRSPAPFAAGSFRLVFGSVLVLVRFGYGVPTGFSATISQSVVLMGVLMRSRAAAGVAALHEAAGGLAGLLLAVTTAIAMLG